MALIDNLMGYWKFDETEEGVIANEVNTYSYSATGYSKEQAGKVGYSFLFDENTSIVFDDNTDFNVSGDKSFSLWIKPTFNDMMIFSKSSDYFSQGYSLHFVDDNSIVFYMNDSDTNAFVQTNSVIQNNVWTHIVVTKGSEYLKIYVNGVLDNTAASQDLDASSTNDFVLGNTYAGDLPYYGYIDEFGIWDRELTPTEIATIYNYGEGLSYPFIPDIQLRNGLFAYWKFNETTGEVIYDSTDSEFNWDRVTDGTTFNAEFEYNENGIINGCLKRKSTGDRSKGLYSTKFTGLTIPKSDFTYNFWVNSNGEIFSGNEFISMLLASENVGPGDPNYRKGMAIYMISSVVQDNPKVWFVFEEDSIHTYVVKYITAPLNICDENWHMLTFTRKKSSSTDDVKGYLDGVALEPSSSLNQDKLVNSFTNQLTLLGQVNPPLNVGMYRDGRLDEFAVWDRALTTLEIMELYNSGDGLPYPFRGKLLGRLNGHINQHKLNGRID